MKESLPIPTSEIVAGLSIEPPKIREVKPEPLKTGIERILFENKKGRRRRSRRHPL